LKGIAKAQKKLDEQEWNSEKMLKKGTKHFIFYALSVIIANTFLSYLIGVDEVWKLI
jgi:polyferredoxin